MHGTGHTPTTVVLVGADGAEVVLARLDARRPGLDLVDRLAGWQLAARRTGRRIGLRDPSDDLCGLLDLVGLSDALAVEPGRQPELGEELGVEEVVEPGDPPAG